MPCLVLVGADPVAPVAAGFDVFDEDAGAHQRAVPPQVAGERVPQGGREGGAGDVEEQALGGAEEVDVEHQRQLGRRQLPRVGEEAAGEHLEGQVAGPVREAHRVQEVVGADAVEPVVDAGHAHVAQGQRGDRVERRQVPQAEGGAEQDEAQCAQGRGPGDVPEAVTGPAGVQQRIVRQAGQAFQRRVGAAQQPAQVVVLAEEGVEPAAHRHRGTVAQAGGPAPDTPAEVGLTLVQGDGHTPLGQGGRRGQARNAPADHGRRGTCPVDAPSSRRGGQDAGPPVPAAAGTRRPLRAAHRAASGRRATKVWVMPVCQPGRGRVRTRSKPAARRRSAKRPAVSKSTTLRHRWR